MSLKAPKQHKEKTIWTPANIVTIVRMLFIPVFVAAILAPWPDWLSNWQAADSYKSWIAAAIFSILAMTDGLDGYLARSRDEVTNFGKFIDPIADKLLVTAALLALIELGTLPSWVALIIITREFLVSGLRMIAATNGKVIAASWVGKWKTVVTIIAIILFIVKDSPIIIGFGSDVAYAFHLISWTIMAAALLLTIASMINYFAASADVLREDF